MAGPGEPHEGTVLVAGVGPVLGTGIARAFAAAGWRVGLLARTTDVTDPLADALPTPARAVRADVTDPEAVGAALETLTDALDAPDCVVHNAAAPGTGGLTDCDPATFASVWRTRAFGGFVLARAVRERLLAGDCRLLVSGTSFATDPGGQVGWDSAAAATRGLVRSLATTDAPATYVAIAARVADGATAGPGAVAARTVGERYVALATAADPPVTTTVTPS